MASEKPKISGPPKIVTLNNAFKLAEQWVNKMNGSGEDEVVEVEPEARPERLGLGAKVPRQSKKVGLSNDPVERRLSAKLSAEKRRVSKNQDSTTPSDRDMVVEDDDEDLDSRSSAFSRKRTVPLTSQLQMPLSSIKSWR